jgi:hypothetical protein
VHKKAKLRAGSRVSRIIKQAIAAAPQIPSAEIASRCRRASAVVCVSAFVAPSPETARPSQLPRCLAPCGLALVLRRLQWRSDRQLQLMPPKLPADGRASAPAQALPKAHPRPPAAVGAVHTENTAGSGGVTPPSEADRLMGGPTPAEPASDQRTSGDPNFEDTLRDLRRVFAALRELERLSPC